MLKSPKMRLTRLLGPVIKKYCSRKGIKFDVNEVCVSKLVLHFHELNLYNYARHADIKIGTLTFYISFWKSLCSFSLVGEVKLYDVSIDWNVISEKTFFIKNFELLFKLRSFKKVLLNIQFENIQLISLLKTKPHIEFYIELPEFTLNDAILIGEGHFCSVFPETLDSSDKMCLTACFKSVSVRKGLPFFNALLNFEKFTLRSRIPNKAITLDEECLLKSLYKRRGDDHHSYYLRYFDIPRNFINAVICTEDPNFWSHCGIDLFFVGYALNENIENHKIARGASTITMQLVRNIFLHHNKTLIRKIEEIIITLLIENYYKVQKEKILELYLNAIEFAPGIFGVKAACTYYFNIEIHELSLTEILVLTYVIPRPIHFVDALLEDSDQLKRNLKNHIDKYSQQMLIKGLISKEDFISIDKQIHFANRFGVLDLCEQIKS